MAARKRGVTARFFDLLKDPVPKAEYVIMCSSFYHFRKREAELIGRMKAAATKAAIVSEPVRNLSSHGFAPLAWVMNKLTNPGAGDYRYRYTLESFREFAERNGATEVLYSPADRNAIAVFETGPKT